MRLVLTFGVLLLGCTPLPSEFTCAADAQCDRQGVHGWCEADGHCSVGDERCPETGRRYALVSGTRANQCVAPVRPLVPPLVADAGFFTNELVELTGVVDTDSPPTGMPFDVWPQINGPPVLVLHAAQVRIGEGVTVRVRGTRPLALLGRDSITVDGILDVGAHLVEPGPGGSAPGKGAGAGGSGRSNLQIHMNSGGGGAGHATVGAAGGVGGATNEVVGGLPGALTYDANLLRLVGGSAGGEGGVDSCEAARGGAGGGAVLLFSLGSVTVGSLGQVVAGGGGGQGGRSCVWHGAGGGGGAGGTVLISAPRIDLRGVIAANGGAGGAGAGVAGGAAAGDGQDGPASTDAARGGQPPPLAGATAGGAGGSLLGPPVTPPMSNLDDGGGGGGAVGHIRLRSTSLERSEATLSPQPLVQPWSE